MNELELIERLTAGLPGHAEVVLAAGDDCAVLECGAPDRQLLFKTDAVVEGVHFTADAPPEKIGHKALARCLSDIAAMAGIPSAAVVTLGLPEGFDPTRVERMYAGMNALARRHQVAIVGGETTRQPGGLWISVALVGFVARGQAVLRSGARPGDALFVTGELGGSLAGRHLEFEPRLIEARWLVEHFPVHALIDVSDGLASDLQHILRASGVGAELLQGVIPISREARWQAREHPGRKTALEAALTDGEDFELLFALPPGHAVALVDAWKTRFPELRLSCIGKIVEGHGVTIRDRKGQRPLTEHGYVHFA